MIDNNAYLRILKQEIEDHIVKKKRFTGDLIWDQSFIVPLYEAIHAVLKRKLHTEDKRATTVSISTLKNIFKYNTYILSNPITPKQAKIVDKLCLFLGYENWDDFIREKSAIKGKRYTQNPDVILEVVRKACEAEFKAYKLLSTIRRTELNKYLVPNGPAYNLINEVLVKHKEKGWVLTNEYNPSLFEIYDMSIKTIKAKEAIVLSNQHWWLRWWDVNTAKYVWFYNDKGQHEFKVVFRDNAWRVLNDFYSATLSGGRFGKIIDDVEYDLAHLRRKK